MAGLKSCTLNGTERQCDVYCGCAAVKLHHSIATEPYDMGYQGSISPWLEVEVGLKTAWICEEEVRNMFTWCCCS